MKHLIASLVLALVLTVGCGAKDGSYADTAAMPELEMTKSEAPASVEDLADMQLAPAPPAAQAIGEKNLEQKLIKTGNIHLQVTDYKASRTKLLQLVKQANGYVSSDNEENSSYRTGSSLVVRVPKQHFDSLLEDMASLAQRVESKSVSIQDVTEEFVDIEARLRTKREVEARYTDILRQAKTIKDVLEVEEHLRVIREEIESREGRLKYLQSQVSLSTINVEMYQVYTNQAYRPSFWSRLGDGLHGGWNGLQSFLVGLVYMWPFLLIFAAMAWWLRKWMQRRRTKQH